MPLTQRPTDARSLTLDQELEALQDAVDRARQNPWHGGDVIEPEFEHFLAALTKPQPVDNAQRVYPNPVWRNRRNTWREVLDQVG